MRKDARLQIRLPSELKEWVQGYARANHTDVSAVVVRFLVRLREAKEQESVPVDAEQI